MLKLIKTLTFVLFVGVFAAATIISCDKPAKTEESTATTDSTEHPSDSSEHPSDSSEHPNEHPADSTK